MGNGLKNKFNSYKDKLKNDPEKSRSLIVTLLILFGAGFIIYLVIHFWGQIKKFFGLGQKAEDDAEERSESLLNSIHVNESNLTMSKTWLSIRTERIYNGFNCSWQCYDGTDEAEIYDALGVDAFSFIMSGVPTSLSKDDVKFIIKDFGMREYSQWNGGEPSPLDGPVDYFAGQSRKMNLFEWIDSDMNSEQQNTVLPVLNWALN